MKALLIVLTQDKEDGGFLILIIKKQEALAF